MPVLSKLRTARKFDASCRTAFKERDVLQVKEIEETYDDDDDDDPDEIDLDIQLEIIPSIFEELRKSIFEDKVILFISDIKGDLTHSTDYLEA